MISAMNYSFLEVFSMLDFRMETFLTVCEYMNFTHAAEKLNLTQPAVSQHIKYLEKEYDSPLFVRDKKKLRLTPAGEILRSALEAMRNDENTLKKAYERKLNTKKSFNLWGDYDYRRICHCARSGKIYSGTP